MAQTFDLGNALQAGDRIAANTQNREFNSLRLSGERQRQDIQQREFNADEQRSNAEKLLSGFAIIRKSPNILPQVLEELSTSGILPREAIPDMLAEAQSNPQAFSKKMDDFEASIKFSLGQGPTAREDRKILTGADKLNRFVDTGEQVFEGVEAPATGGGIFGSGPSTATRTFQDLIDRLQDPNVSEDEKNAVRVELGLDARAGTTSATERIAGDEELTESVADSQATIAQRKKFGERTGASRAKLIDKGFDTIQKLDVNVRNIDKAIAAIDDGAITGVIESKFFPTIRKSTVLLEQIQSELGLDVVGGVTFGALSKGELDLALTVALPLGLQPPELRQWLEDKKAAQNKLRTYFAEQIDFLDQGGSVAGFLRNQERGGQKNDRKLIEQAQQAIQAGADRDAVLSRLNELGVDTSGL